MPKRTVSFVAENYYHIFTRGNNKNPIFSTDRDYLRMLDKIAEYSRLYPLAIHSFCLLPNHFHFLVKQTSDKFPVSKFFGSLLNSHAQYMNKRYGMVGHLMQGRFQAKLVETEASFLQVSRYIHLNPVKEKIVAPNFIKKGDFKRLTTELKNQLRAYRWSSYPYFLREGSTPPYLTVSEILKLAGGWRQYRNFVESKITLEDILNIESSN